MAKKEVSDIAPSETTTNNVKPEEAMPTKTQLFAKIKADHQKGTAIATLKEKYGKDYALKTSDIIKAVYPADDPQRQDMVNQYEGVGD